MNQFSQTMNSAPTPAPAPAPTPAPGQENSTMRYRCIPVYGIVFQIN